MTGASPLQTNLSNAQSDSDCVAGDSVTVHNCHSMSQCSLQLQSSKAESGKFGFCHCFVYLLELVRYIRVQVPLHDAVYHLLAWQESALLVTKITIVLNGWANNSSHGLTQVSRL